MMERSKQQALMFLLGALLVGGVLGFSAEHVWGRNGKSRSWVPREAMYNDLALTPQQRAAMDSTIDARHDQIEAILDPLEPQFDSIKATARAQFRRIMTTDQWGKFEARQRDDSLRRAKSRKAKEPKS